MGRKRPSPNPNIRPPKPATNLRSKSFQVDTDPKRLAPPVVAPHLEARLDMQIHYIAREIISSFDNPPREEPSIITSSVKFVSNRMVR
ncbi:uncharacterized protein TRIVIDRAFT_211410 [Trichoderma virens Gv29-8]|uniref:Uncharacterized protein n=1 Tax=Hypocrea virens (strain Gv29-8 / FGSC 10586) TaxID=413071 RepID=G9MDU0_HYPVG|nr:uncharacterized protein TRIVIDRAFT_211410 [Trichoderma virens Gv29-8]EHK27250.1 hypothetical protein TRIVIDRAFT_211410 [Trichoderma virens Gv29-8]